MRILTLLTAAVTALGVAGAAFAADSPEILSVRHHGHADFDRLVFEIDGPVDVFHQPVRDGEEFVLEMGARPIEPAQSIETGLPRVGRVRIEAIADGAIIRVEAQPRRVRAFVLHDPTRVVVDFASPAKAAFNVPDGTTAVVEAVAPPFDTAGEKTAPTAKLPPVDDPHAPPGSPRALVQSFSGVRIALGILVLSLIGLAGMFLLRSWRKISPEPELAAAGATGGDSPAAHVVEARTQEPAATRPFPPAPQPAQVVKAQASKPAASTAAASTITPAELASPKEGLAALERRLDDEVRARMRLEERLEKTQEELKVLRDRVHRISKRDGRGSD